jgi:hypothetical protein
MGTGGVTQNAPVSCVILMLLSTVVWGSVRSLKVQTLVSHLPINLYENQRVWFLESPYRKVGVD